MNTTQIALLVAPIVIVELVLIVIALRDLLRSERKVRGGSKLMWGVIIIFFNLIGPILYLAVGREGERTGGSDRAGRTARSRRAA